MKEKWFWLPDFASDMGLWEDDLISVSPAVDHVFVPYEEMAPLLGELYKLSGLSMASTVIGWGLGAFALLKHVSARPKDQKWILLSPFADYCSDISEWTAESLDFIAHQTITAADTTVNAFYELIEDELGEWQDDWLKKAKSIKPELLRMGLDYMVKNRIDREIPDLENVQVCYGRMDRAIPPEMTLELRDFMPGVEFKERPKAGHWPPLLLL